jgi:hypothetical protein
MGMPGAAGGVGVVSHESLMEDASLTNLLLSWYYAGYYTGRHQAFKQGAAAAAPPPPPILPHMMQQQQQQQAAAAYFQQQQQQQQSPQPPPSGDKHAASHMAGVKRKHQP